MNERRLSIIPARAVADRRLNETCLRVLGQIGTYTDNEGWCYPRQGEIGKKLGIGRPAVNRAVAKLAELNYLEVHPQRRRDGGKAANLYRVVLDPPVELPCAEGRVPDQNTAADGDKMPPHVPPAIQGVCAPSDTYPCAPSDTGHESLGSTGHVSPGDTSITSHLNESENLEDARAWNDTCPPPGEAPCAGPERRTFDPADDALARLKSEIGKAAFNSWFKRIEIDLPQAGSGPARVRAPTPFIANHIRQHFGEPLERLLGRRIEVVARAGAKVPDRGEGNVAHGVRRSKAEKAGLSAEASAKAGRAEA